MYTKMCLMYTSYSPLYYIYTLHCELYIVYYIEHNLYCKLLTVPCRYAHYSPLAAFQREHNDVHGQADIGIISTVQ